MADRLGYAKLNSINNLKSINKMKKYEYESSERGREIATEALRQLGGNKFITMTGAENLAYNDLASNGDVDLTFTIGGNSKRVKHVLVRYDYGKDLYKMKFHTAKLELVAEYDEVYCDMLQEIFESATGMYTSL
jgi:hypothetical protein